MKDESKTEKAVSVMGERVLAALDEKFDELCARFEALEELLNDTLQAVSERSYADTREDDLSED